MKLVVIIDNKPVDKKLLDKLFVDGAIVDEEIEYLSILMAIDDDNYEVAADIAFTKISQKLNNKHIPSNTVDLRFVVDLFLRPRDREDTKTPESKTGLNLLNAFVDKYYNEFGEMHCFIMSKISTGGPVYDYTAEQLSNISGGMSLLEKPITKVGMKNELIDSEYPVYMYTDILDEKHNSKLINIAFVKAIIWGERN